MKKPIRIFLRAKLPVILLSLILCSDGISQNQTEIDSLKQLIANTEQDSSHIKLLWSLGDHYRNTMPDTALLFYQEALDISTELNRKKDLAMCLHRIGKIQILKSDYELAMENYLRFLEICEELGEKKGIAIAYNGIGIIYRNLGSYDKAVEYYLKSIRIKEELGDKGGMANTYNNIAIIHATQDSNDKAIEYFLKSLEIKEELGDKRGIASTFNNIAIIYTRQDSYDKAIEYFLEALTINEEIDNKVGASMCLANIGNAYSDQGSNDKAIDYYLEALKIKEELGERNGMAILYKNIADLNVELADSIASNDEQRLDYLNKSVKYGKMSLELAREIKSLPIESNAASILRQAFAKLGKFKEAYEYSNLYNVVNDSLFNEEKTAAIQDMAARYETEKKQHQIELQETQLIAKDATIKQQKTFRNALAAGFLAVVAIVLVVIQAYIQKRRANRKIMEQNELISEANEELQQLNEEINTQKEEIESQRDYVFTQNKAITDSINYAQRIQSAMLPPESYIAELLNENFILFKPRDIVSGDFYWIKQVNQYIVLVAADCTGHGVPGAFMSMLGISYLTEIVQRREITQANQVLNELRKQIKYSLRQHGGRDEAKDGIDMALCVLDLKNSMMQYSGANNSLYLIRDKDGKPELKEIKADRMPLGYYQGKDSSFTNHDIALEQGDTFYVFSDGFIDQKGGKDNKRYMSKAFKNLLLEIQDLPMPEQRKIMDQTLSSWMGNNSQTDDILVIGIRM